MDEKNDREINDILMKLKKSVGQETKKNTGKKSGVSGGSYEGTGFDRELAELLGQRLIEKGDGEVMDDEPEYSVGDLEIIKDGTVDPKILGDEDGVDNLLSERLAAVGEKTAQAEAESELERDEAAVPESGEAEASVFEPDEIEEHALEFDEPDESEPMPIEAEEMPPAIKAALEDAFEIDDTDILRDTQSETTVEADELNILTEDDDYELSVYDDEEDEFELINAAELYDEISAAEEVTILDGEDGLESFDEPDIADGLDIAEVYDYSDELPDDGTENGEEALFAGEYEPYVERTETEKNEAVAAAVEAEEDVIAAGERQAFAESIPVPGAENLNSKSLQKEKNADDTLVGVYGYCGSEYDSHALDEKIKRSYSSAGLYAVLRLCGVVLITILLLLLENIGFFGVVMPKLLNFTESPVIYTLICTLLFIGAVAVLWRDLYRGFLKIYKFDPEPHSLSAAAAVFNIVYNIVVMIINPAYASLYNFPAALMLCFSAVYNLLIICRESDTFEVVSAQGERYTLIRMGNTAEDAGQDVAHDEKRQIPVYRVKKAVFTEGYFRRTNHKNKGVYLLNFIIIPLVVSSVVAAIITASITSDAALAAASFMASFMLSMPAFAILLMCMPEARAAKILRRGGCAIVGGAGVDEYSRKKLIVFDDSSMFPAVSIRTKGIKLYDGFEIFDVLTKTGSLFSVIGGPLDEIFDVSSEEYHRSENVKLIKVESGGVEALLDGSVHILAGSGEFLEKYGIYPKRNPKDEQLIAAGEVTIIYIAIDKRAAARLYVDYRPDEIFERTAEMLAAGNTSVAINTCDPGIDDGLLGRKRGAGACEVKILRAPSTDRKSPAQSIDSGVVALRGALDIAAPICMSGQLRQLRRRGLVAVLGVFILNIILCATLAATVMIYNVVSGLAAAYMLFWNVPIFIAVLRSITLKPRGEEKKKTPDNNAE